MQYILCYQACFALTLEQVRMYNLSVRKSGGKEAAETENRINYYRIFEETLREADLSAENGKKPSLLLHACCAPCSSHVLECLSGHFEITMFYYNPNISPEPEFKTRLNELSRFLEDAGYGYGIESPPYVKEEFDRAVSGLEQLGEGSKRCYRCYELRLRKTAEAALSGGFSFFTTTLSISPYKNSEWLNEIGIRLGKEYGVRYLCSDFKKKNGYKRSIELSEEYGLYRQDYCGCEYSRKEAESRRKSRSESFPG